MNRTLLALVATFFTFTFTFNPTPAFASVYDDVCTVGEDALVCLERVYGTILETATQAEAQVAQLRQAQTKATDPTEIIRLQQMIDGKDREIVALRKERDELKVKVESLSTQVTSLSTQVATLDASVKALLAREAEKPIAEEPTSIPVEKAPASEARLAGYQPGFDPNVFGRMGYRNTRPEVPDPIAFPDVRWEEAGNCLTFWNRKTDQVTGWVMVRVAGKTRVVDSTGHVVATEIPLGPGDEFSFCSDEQKPHVSVTNAQMSTSSSAERHWSDTRRQWVPLERLNSWGIHESFGADRRFDLW